MTAERERIESDHVPNLSALYSSTMSSALLGLCKRGSRTSDVAPTLPNTELHVPGVALDRDRLGAYQRMVGEAVSDDVPAGFVHVLAFPLSVALLAADRSPIPVLGVVHLANEVTYFRTVPADSKLDLLCWLENLRPHRRGAQLDSVAEARIDDELVWRGVSTYLSRAVTLPGADKSGTKPAEPSEVYWELPTALWRLEADAGRRYAQVSGDYNPIHLSALTAKTLGFNRAIIHGMYSAARALALVGSGRGRSYRWTVSFGKPVFLPARVPVRVEPEDNGFRYRGWNSKGKDHFAGVVTPLAAG